MGTPRTDKSGQIIKRTDEEPLLVTLLGRMRGEIQKALPKHLTAERMTRVALTAIKQSSDLMRCSTASVLGSIMSSAQLGLEPNTPLGLCYLIPYNGACNLVIGYQGFLEIARRSGLVAGIQAHTVREGDEFRFQYGLHPDLVHIPSMDPDRTTKPIQFVYAVAHLKDRDALPIFVVLSMAEVARRRAKSTVRNSGPWVTDEAAMVRKTAVRELFKWLPKSIELATAEAMDEVAERGQAQAEHWNPEIVDALKREGVVIDAVPEPEPAPLREPGQEG